MWDKVIEKAINTEAKANLQLPFEMIEINSRCLRGYRPTVKKDKDNINREHRDETPKFKARFHNSFSANQPQTQTPKKDKRGSRQGGHPATKVNVNEIAKKNKDKAKNRSHIKYYTCKQKDHYANKCLEKSKN